MDFETIKQRFDAFWECEILDRPLIHITAPRKHRVYVEIPNVKTLEDKWINIDYILKRLEYHFENTVFLGDAIPQYWPNLGPNSLTAFLGVKWIQTSIEKYKRSEDYTVFRNYLENRLREKLKRVEDLLTGIECSYP
ncbi:hypothetical protein KEJ27_09340 [Candidatus Bathyarchaeota archaeon]|nr:hypothetical protein [Candidatus Bathyarchaeota archaeon]MBS7618703.1 hypothetical protein [Candidatus Bathyarchaeota archaeon]